LGRTEAAYILLLVNRIGKDNRQELSNPRKQKVGVQRLFIQSPSIRQRRSCIWTDSWFAQRSQWLCTVLLDFMAWWQFESLSLRHFI